LFLSPHSPALPIAPYTPREPLATSVTMQGLARSKPFGTCTINVTLNLPLPSSA